MVFQEVTKVLSTCWLFCFQSAVQPFQKSHKHGFTSRDYVGTSPFTLVSDSSLVVCTIKKRYLTGTFDLYCIWSHAHCSESHSCDQDGLTDELWGITGSGAKTSSFNQCLSYMSCCLADRPYLVQHLWVILKDGSILKLVAWLQRRLKYIPGHNNATQQCVILVNWGRVSRDQE